MVEWIAPYSAIGVSDEKKVSKIAIDETILAVIAAIALPFQSGSRTLMGR